MSFTPRRKGRQEFDSVQLFSGNGSAYGRIYEMVRRIPRGKVATYGQIAGMIGRITPRMVGYAMAALRGRTDVPWQRVINHKGEISPRAAGDGGGRQRKMLEAEGIRFDVRGRVDLGKVRWTGSNRRSGERGARGEKRIERST